MAVQSHWFGTGSVVPWAEAGVGAVATQSMADPSYGPRGLELMRAGKSASDTLSSLLASDRGGAVRQIAMVDATGGVATHTGKRCIEAAGHIVDADLEVSCQANLMANDSVWTAMVDAYRASLANADDLAERLVAALEAAERAGGDVRGKQSAALIVVGGQRTDEPWLGRLFDLRVEDHPDPLPELRRLIVLRRAYQHMGNGDAALEVGDFDVAVAEYHSALSFAPDIVEIQFWAAVTLGASGRYDEAGQLLLGVFEQEPVWRELLPKLVASGLIEPTDADATLAVVDRLPSSSEKRHSRDTTETDARR